MEMGHTKDKYMYTVSAYERYVSGLSKGIWHYQKAFDIVHY